jgi:transposase
VHRLAALGWTNAAIARQLDLDRGTVQKWLSCTQFPERQPRPPRRTLLTEYQSYLHRRWQEGCGNARQMWQELRAQGYRGGYSRVAAYVTRLRVGQAVPLHGQLAPRRAACPSVRQLKGLLLRPLPALSAAEAAVLAEMGRRSAAVGVAHGLAVDFASLVRDHQPDELSHWVRVAEASGIPELVGFARGIRRDFAAVYAGLEGRYSNGPVEGQVNRLKALKRRSVRRVTRGSITLTRSQDQKECPGVI